MAISSFVIPSSANSRQRYYVFRLPHCFICLFVCSFIFLVRHCYHNISWMAWSILIKRTKYLVAPTL